MSASTLQEFNKAFHDLSHHTAEQCPSSLFSISLCDFLPPSLSELVRPLKAVEEKQLQSCKALSSLLTPQHIPKVKKTLDALAMEFDKLCKNRQRQFSYDATPLTAAQKVGLGNTWVNNDWSEKTFGHLRKLSDVRTNILPDHIACLSVLGAGAPLFCLLFDSLPAAKQRLLMDFVQLKALDHRSSVEELCDSKEHDIEKKAATSADLVLSAEAKEAERASQTALRQRRVQQQQRRFPSRARQKTRDLAEDPRNHDPADFGDEDAAPMDVQDNEHADPPVAAPPKKRLKRGRDEPAA
jgi:hypothetical protein